MEMLITNDEFLNLTPPDRAERVAYLMWRYMEWGKQEAESGIKDEVVTDILQKNWHKKYNVWRGQDSKVQRFRELTDSKIALDVMKELHKANRLDLLSDIANYTGEYAKMVDKEFNIIRGDAFNYGSNIPTQIKFV